MAKRLRNVRMLVSFTEEEWQLIQAKMLESKMLYFSVFAREMLLTGEVKCYDFSNLKELSAILGRLAGSINQVAKRCNETGSMYKNDVEQMRREYLQVKAVCQERLIKMLRKL
jgi:hypothetical protein